jgi:hypothetical protein
MEKPCVKTYLVKDIFGFGIGFGFVLGFDAWKNFGLPFRYQFGLKKV